MRVLPLLLLPQVLKTDHPARLINLSLNVSLLPWTERSYHTSGMSVLSFIPCIIYIYLPCSLFLLFPSSYHHTSRICQPTNGFLAGCKVPGPTQDFCFVCIFNLELDQNSRAVKLHIRTAFKHLSTIWYTGAVMSFSKFKDESLSECPSGSF